MHCVVFVLQSQFQKDSAIHLAVVDCLLSIIIFPYELRSTQPAKCNSTGLISLCGFSFFFSGQSWKSRGQRPPGEACKYCLPREYFSAEMLFHGFNFRASFLFSFNLSKKTSLCPVQTTQTCKMSSHPLLNVIYIIIGLGVCQ